MRIALVKSFALATILFTAQNLAYEAETEVEHEFALEASPKVQCLTECCQTLKGRAQMHYTYYQNTGHFVGGSGQWAINTRAYSGSGSKGGLNNPARQCDRNIGPLPAAKYKLAYCKNTMHSNPVRTRPCSFYLEPL